MQKGLFITFEGIDGCGKSTQLNKVADMFKANGNELLMIREPGGTVIGEKIRGVLLDKKNDSMTSTAELLLYEAARAQITEEKIVPALNSGITVICDRFYDSTTAYQGYARNLGVELTTTLNNIATGGVAPDLTFILDIDPLKALERRLGRGEEEDRLEALGTSFQEKVREGYLSLAKADTTNRVHVIDATGTPDEIFANISGIISDFIAKRS